jgi:ABC-type thiamine transport system ATPase subunit
VTVLELSKLRSGPVLMADARLGSGLTVVTGEARTALSRLVELVAGVERPAHGQVRLDGDDPYGSPALRRSTAALLGTERLPLAPTVFTAVGRVLAARGDDQRGGAVLDQAGLGAWSSRKPRDLDPTETRAVALALALSHPRARLLALLEPFRVGSSVSTDFVRDAIKRHAGRGAAVLVAVADAEPLRTVSSQRLELRGGFLGPARPGLGAFQGAVALETRTAAPQRLIRALADEPAAAGVRWDERSAPGVVVVLGTELEALATAVSHAATTAGVAIDAMTPFTVQNAPAPAHQYGAWSAQAGGAAGLPPLASPQTPDQSVGMPDAFADPTRPSSGSGSR